MREVPAANMTPRAMFRRDLLWTDARDVWHCAVASVWAEFSLPPPHHRPVPLLDATPLVLWVWARPEEKQQQPRGEKTERATRRLLSEFYGEPAKENVGLHLLAVSSQLVSVQLDHHQLLFLLRLLETLSEMGAFLSSDSARISAPATPAGMVIGAVLPQLDVSIILPSCGPERAESGSCGDRDTPHGDAEQELEPRLETPGPEDMEAKLESLQPVTDHSDPLSLLAEAAPSPGPAATQEAECLPEPPVKLQLHPATSNGMFPSLRATPTNTSKSRTLTSSFHSMMDGLSGGAQLGTRSPDPDLDTLSVRSDESGDSSWQESEAGWTMVSDNTDIGDGLFKVSKDGMDRSVKMIDVCHSVVICPWFSRGPSPAEMAEEVYEVLSEGGSRAELGPGAAEEARLVSVLTLHLGRLAIAQVAGDKGSALLLDTSTLSTSLATDQDYQQFQFRLGKLISVAMMEYDIEYLLAGSGSPGRRGRRAS